jgi:hypothetical protein
LMTSYCIPLRSACCSFVKLVAILAVAAGKSHELASESKVLGLLPAIDPFVGVLRRQKGNE